MSDYEEYLSCCKGCREIVEFTNEVGLCEYCQNLMEETENANKLRSNSGRRKAEEGH